MAHNNTHRAFGRAVTPVGTAGRALRGTGGAAVLGTVLLGSAFAAGPAQAAPAASPAAPAISAQAAAPAAPAPAHATSVSTAEKLRWGSQGSAVEQLQSALNDHGDSLSVDGKFGKLTHGAVKDFQRSHDLKIDGVVGPETRGALNGSDAPVSGGGTSAPAPAKSAISSQQAIVDAARSQIGASYSWGTSKPGVSFDCSGLSSYAYEQAGIDLPRTSSQQVAAGTTISKSEAQPGDLVVWPGHLGIYAGGDTVIDAGRSPGAVTERTIWGSPTFVTFR
ncbi:C40 family peptidase [Brachybacterium vulturis]|uniref:C40 family peptidase n=1 Tax=Brachybacterium vulturis TaxID=2017484 RepID=UPI003735C4E0